MIRLAAQSLTPAVRAWLRDTRHARILHVFERAVNLAAGADVCALVSPDIGNGPFNVVLPAYDFARRLTASDTVSVTLTTIRLGDLLIDTTTADVWNPCPDWHLLRAQRARLRAHVPAIHAVLRQYAPANSLAHLAVDLTAPPSGLDARFVETARQRWQDMLQAALGQDPAACVISARGLAGLGGGLTPAGDDWLVGCALAAHLGLPSPPAAAILLAAIRVAAPATNPLSASWLRAAADGACGQLWHTLLASCLQPDPRTVQQAAVALVRQGHTSGADALAGFVALLAGA